MKKGYFVFPVLGILVLMNDANAVSPLPVVNFTESTGSTAMRNNLTQCVTGKLCDLPVINDNNDSVELTDDQLRGQTVVYTTNGPAHGYQLDRGYIHTSFNEQKFLSADELEIQITIPKKIAFIQDCDTNLDALYVQQGLIKHADSVDCWGSYIRFNNKLTPEYDSTGGIRLINDEKWRDYSPTGFLTIDNWLDPSFYLTQWRQYEFGAYRTFQSIRRDIRFKNASFPATINNTPNKSIIEYDYEIHDLGESVVPIKHNNGTPPDKHIVWKGPTKTGTVRVTKKSAARLSLKCGTKTINKPIMLSSSITSTVNRGVIALTRQMNTAGTKYVQNNTLVQLQQSCPSALTLEILFVQPLAIPSAASQLSIRYGTLTDETQYWQDYGNEVLKDLQVKYRVWDDLNTINTKLGSSNAQILQYMRDYSSTAITGNIKDLLMLFYAAKGMDPVAALQAYVYFYSPPDVLQDILIPVVDLAAAPQPDWQTFHDLYNTGGAKENIDFVFYMQILGNLNQVRKDGSVNVLNNLVSTARKELDNELARSKYFIALSEHAIQATQDNLCKIRQQFTTVPDMALTPVTCKTPVALQQINKANGIKVNLNTKVSSMPVSALK